MSILHYDMSVFLPVLTCSSTANRAHREELDGILFVFEVSLELVHKPIMSSDNALRLI